MVASLTVELCDTLASSEWVDRWKQARVCTLRHPQNGWTVGNRPGCGHWSMWRSRQIPKCVIIGHCRERNLWNELLHVLYQMDLNIKYETMEEITGEFIYGLRVRKHLQPKTKAKDGTKRHLNMDRSWSPRNKLCKWPSPREKKVIRPLKSQEQWKLKHKAPFSHPLK